MEEYDKEYKRTHRDSINEYQRGDKHKAYEKKYWRQRPLMRYWKAKKSSVKQKGIPWDIEPDDLEWPTHCPVLNIPLKWGRGEGNRGNRDDYYSLDRMDPSKGYVKGNVIVVSMLANRIKSNATVEQIEAVARFYRKLIDST